MTTALYTITSSLHSEVDEDVRNEKFIRDIESALGYSFTFRGSDFSDYGKYPSNLIYVRTGGTEGLFKALGLKGRIRLLTSGRSNSLAASMEILSWLNANGQSGEILHGSAYYIAERIKGQKHSESSAAGPVRPMPAIDLGGIRLGIIGKPSDWLISSDVDFAEAKNQLNAELVEIPMDELIGETRAAAGETDLRSFDGSVAIYDALKAIIGRYGLSGLTIRCFDLLESVHNTGCLALARLNAEGIPSSCEGDVPALLSMAAALKMTGKTGFQCNLSRINGDELLFAHCTVPLDMVTSFRYDTHFESGIGTAIKGEIATGPATIFKIAPDLKRCVMIPAEIVRNQSEPGLCRTQIIVRAYGARDYLLKSPLANHHIIVPGTSPAIFANSEI